MSKSPPTTRPSRRRKAALRDLLRAVDRLVLAAKHAEQARNRILRDEQQEGRRHD